LIRSMTGYGRGEAEKEGIKFTVEIKSLNHRFLDIYIKMPKVISALDGRIRNTVSSKVYRGKVDVFINLEVTNKSFIYEVSLNHPLVESYIRAISELEQKYKIKNDIGISKFIELPDVLITTEKDIDEGLFWNILEEALLKALDMLVGMREREGMAIYNDLLARITLIKDFVREIEERCFNAVLEYKEELQKRVKELLADNIMVLDENRLMTEVAIYADKSNITEEITRLKSHIEQFELNLKNGGIVGKKLDFIMQEMNREANTINSKTNNNFIISKVIELKSEIEKIREQIQNIE